MSEYFKKKLEEQFELLRQQIFFEQRPGQDPGAELGPEFQVKPAPSWKDITLDFRPGNFGPDEAPPVDLPKPGVNPQPPKPNEYQKPKPNGDTIPVDSYPSWMQEFLEGIFGPGGLPSGYSVEVYLTMGEVWYAIVGPDGQVVRYIVQLPSGQPWALPRGSFVSHYDNGVPVFYVPSSLWGMPGGYHHAGGAYVEYRGVPGWPPIVQRAANGLWYVQEGGEWVPWEPNGSNQDGDIEEAGGIVDYWNDLSPWARALIIAAAAAALTWMGIELYNWLRGNGHVGTEGGGPPIPPDGDDSSEGGDGGDDGGDDGPPGGP